MGRADYRDYDGLGAAQVQMVAANAESAYRGRIELVLEPGGHLLIEVPDPECRFGRLLGRYWVPWLQPQHQVFLPVANLCAALTDDGFEVVEVEHCPAQPAMDVAGAMWLWSTSLAPPPRLPWRPVPSQGAVIRRWMTFAAMAPAGLVGVGLGWAAQPVIKARPDPWSNAYRVLARRR